MIDSNEAAQAKLHGDVDLNGSEEDSTGGTSENTEV